MTEEEIRKWKYYVIENTKDFDKLRGKIAAEAFSTYVNNNNSGIPNYEVLTTYENLNEWAGDVSYIGSKIRLNDQLALCEEISNLKPDEVAEEEWADFTVAYIESSDCSLGWRYSRIKIEEIYRTELNDALADIRVQLWYDALIGQLNCYDEEYLDYLGDEAPIFRTEYAEVLGKLYPGIERFGLGDSEEHTNWLVAADWLQEQEQDEMADAIRHFIGKYESLEEALKEEKEGAK